MYPKELENEEIFLTFGVWSVYPSADVMGWWVCLLKDAQSYWALPSSQCLFFLSSHYLPHFFLAVSLVLNSVLSLCCWFLAWEQHDSSPPYPSTPSLSATICPTLASHRSFPPSQSISTLHQHIGSQACYSCFLSLSYAFLLFGHVLCSVIPLSWVPLTWKSCV